MTTPNSQRLDQLMIGPSGVDQNQIVNWDRFTLTIKNESGDACIAVVDELRLSPVGSKCLTLFWYQLTVDRHCHFPLMRLEGRDDALVAAVREAICEAVFARADSLDMPEIIAQCERESRSAA